MGRHPTDKAVKVGKKYLTRNSGPVEVIEKCTGTDKYKVRFVRTGTVRVVRGSQINEMSLRDPYALSVCGVACTGEIKTKGKYKRYYSVWHDMICRCYDPNNKRAHAYRNVTVSEEWLVFKNFYEDCPHMEGFDEELFQKGEIALDKDTKQRHMKHKVYSKDTCVWLSLHDNNLIQDSQQKPFVAISPDGTVYHDFNITNFARVHDIKRHNISNALHGRVKSANGWKFSYEDMI